MPTRKYPKGIAKREEILDNALDVIAERGFSRATLRELADAANLSITGLVHHFGTKEELLTAVLRRRDERDVGANYPREPETTAEMIGDLTRVVERNTTVPGLVHLYTNLSADATAPDHPAHDYFLERYRMSLAIGRDALAHLQDIGELPKGIDPSDLALLTIAMLDGLQLYWQFDEQLDMARTLGALSQVLELASKNSSAATTASPDVESADLPADTALAEPS